MTLLLLEMLRGNALSAFAASASQGRLVLPAADIRKLLPPPPPDTILPRGSRLDRMA